MPNRTWAFFIGLLVVLVALYLIAHGGGRSDRTTGKFPGIKLDMPLSVAVLLAGLAVIAFSYWPWTGVSSDARASTSQSSTQVVSTQLVSTPPVAVLTSSVDTPASPPTAPSPVLRAVTITAPHDGDRVSTMSLKLEGTATNLGEARLRLFTLSDNGQHYLQDDFPLPVSGTSWSFLVPQIGADSSDVGHVFTFEVAYSGSKCEATLKASKPNSDGDIAFPQLPDDCTLAAEVHITKAAP
jgi:hypothetical protein